MSWKGDEESKWALVRANTYGAVEKSGGRGVVERRAFIGTLGPAPPHMRALLQNNYPRLPPDSLRPVLPQSQYRARQILRRRRQSFNRNSAEQGRSQDLVSGGTHFGGGDSLFFASDPKSQGSPLCTFGYLRISGGPPPRPPWLRPWCRMQETDQLLPAAYDNVIENAPRSVSLLFGCPFQEQTSANSPVSSWEREEEAWQTWAATLSSRAIAISSC